MTQHTPGPWLIATSNSWRRIVSVRGDSVCEPCTQHDGHPDLWFRNGGHDGPDASLIAAAPELLEALQRLVSNYERGIHVEFGGSPWLKEKLEELDYARGAIAKATGSQP